MINVVIIRNNPVARDKLISILTEIDSNINIVRSLSSIEESLFYFKNPDPIDIIFCDVHLSDGLSFEIFSVMEVEAPVIFIAGYDRFLLKSFENNGIDFLLTPLNKFDIIRSISKYKKLENQSTYHPSVFKSFFKLSGGKKRKRLLVKKGIETISLKLEEIVLIYTENKIVYVLDTNGKKYLSDKTMNELQLLLDDSLFFRANRKYIVNLEFIESFKPFEKVKLLVNLQVHEKNHSIIISQNSAPEFRNWILNK